MTHRADAYQKAYGKNWNGTKTDGFKLGGTDYANIDHMATKFPECTSDLR